MAQNDPSFLGRGWPFPPRFDPQSGQVMMVEAEDDIVESLRILMQTRPGERIMQPDYGCRLQDFVFEPMSGETRAAVENAIRQAIRFFEPRIRITGIELSQENWHEGVFSIRLDYVVKATNSRQNIVFPFYATEGTLVSDMPVPNG